MSTHSSQHELTTAPEPQPARRFTLSEANRAIPFVSRVVDDITLTYARIVELRRLIESEDRDRETLEAYEDEYDHAMDRLSELVDELHLVGAELRDFERGLVDFPADHEGRAILLTWELGDSEIQSWHEPDASLQPVALLLDEAA